MKKYIAIEPTKEENSICLETGYSEGGVNWWNGATEKRGYYLYCTPVQITTRKTSDGNREYQTVTQILGKGNKLLLKEVNRRSKKAEEEAEKLAEEKADFLLAEVMKKYSLNFSGVYKIFRTTDLLFKNNNGKEVAVLRQMTRGETDIEFGKMYKVRFFDGLVLEAFDDELMEVKNEEQI